MKKNTDGLKQSKSLRLGEESQNNRSYSNNVATMKGNGGEGSYVTETEETTRFGYIQDEEGIKIIYGRVQVTNKVFQSIEEADAYVKTKPWDIIECIAISAAGWLTSVHEEKKHKAKKANTNTKSKTKKEN